MTKSFECKRMNLKYKIISCRLCIGRDERAKKHREPYDAYGSNAQTKLKRKFHFDNELSVVSYIV